MSPWVCDTTPHQKRRIGKTIEELGELLSVLGRLQIQVVDAIDPGSGKTNRQRLQEEIADVLAQLPLTIAAFSLNTEDIANRIATKQRQMHEWEAHYHVHHIPR